MRNEDLCFVIYTMAYVPPKCGNLEIGVVDIIIPGLGCVQNVICKVWESGLFGTDLVRTLIRGDNDEIGSPFRNPQREIGV